MNTVGGNQIGTVTMQNNMEVPQETKTEIPHDPEVSLLVIFTKEKTQDTNCIIFINFRFSSVPFSAYFHLML